MSQSISLQKGYFIKLPSRPDSVWDTKESLANLCRAMRTNDYLRKIFLSPYTRFLQDCGIMETSEHSTEMHKSWNNLKNKYSSIANDPDFNALHSRINTIDAYFFDKYSEPLKGLFISSSSTTDYADHYSSKFDNPLKNLLTSICSRSLKAEKFVQNAVNAGVLVKPKHPLNICKNVPCMSFSDHPCANCPSRSNKEPLEIYNLDIGVLDIWRADAQFNKFLEGMVYIRLKDENAFRISANVSLQHKNNPAKEVDILIRGKKPIAIFCTTSPDKVERKQIENARKAGLTTIAVTTASNAGTMADWADKSFINIKENPKELDELVSYIHSILK